MLVLRVEKLPRRYGPAEAAPTPIQLPRGQVSEHRRNQLDDEGLRIRAHSGASEWHQRSLAQRGGGVGGEVPSRDPYLLGSFSTRQTNISWRARVAPRNASQRGPGRAPPPAPPAQVTHRATSAKIAEHRSRGLWRNVEGWGWGEVPSRDPYLLGELLNAKNQNLVAGQEWPTRIASQRGPGGHLPQPRPGKLRDDYVSAARDAAALARRASTTDMGTAGEPRVAARTLGPWKSEPPVATRSWSWQICT